MDINYFCQFKTVSTYNVNMNVDDLSFYPFNATFETNVI